MPWTLARQSQGLNSLAGKTCPGYWPSRLTEDREAWMELPFSCLGPTVEAAPGGRSALPLWLVQVGCQPVNCSLGSSVQDTERPPTRRLLPRRCPCACLVPLMLPDAILAQLSLDWKRTVLMLHLGSPCYILSLQGSRGGSSAVAFVGNWRFWAAPICPAPASKLCALLMVRVSAPLSCCSGEWAPIFS